MLWLLQGRGRRSPAGSGAVGRLGKVVVAAVELRHLVGFLIKSPHFPFLGGGWIQETAMKARGSGGCSCTACRDVRRWKRGALYTFDRQGTILAWKDPTGVSRWSWLGGNWQPFSSLDERGEPEGLWVCVEVHRGSTSTGSALNVRSVGPPL